MIRKIPAGNNYYYLGCSENIFLCSLVERDWYVGGVYSHSEYYTQEEIATLVVEGWMDSPRHKENILKDKDIDLAKFPVPTWTPKKDPNPFITGG